ncbi:MAG: hypothetical protein Q8S11_01890 [Daejeonella sp.]|uniref:hypothetical protein n=1 Tax=Daejeonella sp. TaxID=2805397 RepID=UPI002736372B|nr:hypothetical protein [Daejeonella sp.]MDP3467054.1 hypothetical protein [Daejeonella sp.]
MAKSNYLFGILSAAALFICGYAGRDYLVSRQGESIKLKDESRKGEAEFSKQTTQGSTAITQGPIHKEYQEGVLPGVKSVFQTTDLRFRQSDGRVTTKKIYDSQIGIREKGINSGPQVEEYLHYVNLKKGQPWCAAFICWVYGQDNVDNPRTGWSPDLFKSSKVIWTRAESRKLKVESRAYEPGANLPAGQAGSQDPIAIGSRHSRIAYTYPIRQTTGNRQRTTDSRQQATDNWQPTIGDVFGIYFSDKKRIAHVGFIDQWDGTWLITVEGNTNVSGGREGDGVYRKRRPVKSIYQVARYIRQP